MNLSEEMDWINYPSRVVRRSSQVVEVKDDLFKEIALDKQKISFYATGKQNDIIFIP